MFLLIVRLIVVLTCKKYFLKILKLGVLWFLHGAYNFMLSQLAESKNLEGLIKGYSLYPLIKGASLN